MSNPKADVPYGTLDLLVLKTLDTMGPMHGFGIARRIEQISQDLLHLNQGSIYKLFEKPNDTQGTLSTRH